MSTSYNGSVKLTAGVVADGGNFPLVNISDVYVEGDVEAGTWTNLGTEFTTLKNNVGNVATTDDIRKLFAKEE